MNRNLRSGISVPSSVRPTSFTFTTEPSAFVRSGTAANSSGVFRSDWTRIEALRRCPGTAGAPPSWPAETSTLYARSAATTSSDVIPYFVSLSGSSQTRIEYAVPKTWTSPTPGTRPITDSIFETV